MPSQAANKADIKTNGHKVFCKMSVYVPAIVASGTVGLIPTLSGIKNIGVTFTTGSKAVTLPGMVIEFKAPGGASKGKTRLRFQTTASPTLLQLRELSAGTIQIETGDEFYIYAEVPPSDKLVVAKSSFAPDNMVFATDGASPFPLICSGGHWAGNTDMLPIIYKGDNTTIVDALSVGSITHLWTLPAGLSFADSTTSASANPHVTGSAGTYTVKHTVTDSDTGATVTASLIVIIENSTNTYDILLDSPQGSDSKGFAATVQMFNIVPLSAIPDGAHVIIWKEEYNNNVRQSFGQKIPSRSHIILDGFIRHENGSLSGKDGAEKLTFDIISPMARLEEIAGYSKAMIRDQTPDAWGDVASLTTLRAVTQLWQFYTTMCEAGYDLIFSSNYKIYDYPEFYIQKNNPLAQILEITDGVDARMICDRSGHFECHTRPELMAIGDRASLPVTMALDEDDISDYEYSREHWRTTQLLECRGFIAGTSDSLVSPIFSRWPGLSPGLGTETPIIERLIALSATELNTRCGLRGASADGVYYDVDGLLQMSLDLTLKLRGSYDVFDFYGEYITIDVTTRKRQIDFSDHLFVLVSVQVEYQNGTATTTLKLRTATNAAAGESYVEPTTLIDTPTHPSPDVNYTPGGTMPPNPTPTPLPAGATPTGKLFGIEYGHDKCFATITNGTTWFLVGSGTITGAMRDACSDPYNYGRKFVITEDGLWKIDDPYGAPTVASLVASAATITGTGGVYPTRILMSINRKGYIICSFGFSSIALSFDYGVTWNQYAVIGSVETANTGSSIPDLDVNPIALSPYNNPAAANQGWVYSIQTDVLGGGVYKHDLYRSQDWGRTWTRVAHDFDANNGNAARRLMIPYTRTGGVANKNDSNQIVYYGRNGYLYKVTAGGTSTGLIVNSVPAGTQGNFYWINSYTLDGGIMAMTNRETFDTYLYVSLDGGTSWSNKGIYSPSDINTIPGVTGWSNDPNIFVAWAGPTIFTSTDGGVSWTNITGNLATLIAFNFNALWIGYDLVDYIIPS